MEGPRRSDEASVPGGRATCPPTPMGRRPGLSSSRSHGRWACQEQTPSVWVSYYTRPETLAETRHQAVLVPSPQTTGFRSSGQKLGTRKVMLPVAISWQAEALGLLGNIC